jgi:GT2 family glycosyltransferase
MHSDMVQVFSSYGANGPPDSILDLASAWSPVALVDNGYCESNGRATRNANVTTFHSPTNTGVAGAINQGLQFATAKGARLLLYWDQDSAPDREWFDRTLASMRAANEIGFPLVSSTWRSGPTMTEQLPRWSQRPVVLTPGVFTVNTAILSGTLFSVDVLNSIGGANEELGLDFVDTDLSFRAFDATVIRHLVVALHPFVHTIGSRHLAIMGRRVPYYQHARRNAAARNFFFVMRCSRGWRHINWVTGEGVRLLSRHLYSAVQDFYFRWRPR